MSDKKEELEQIRASMKVFRDKEAELMQELGEGDVLAESERRQKDAAAFDQLSPGELAELYTNHRERWDAVMAAKEAEGMRRLLHPEPYTR